MTGKISQLTLLDEVPNNADVFEIIDVSDTTMSVNGTNKRVTRGNLLGGVVKSDVTGISGADAITNMVSLTQAEYDAIVTKDASTFYVILG